MSYVGTLHAEHKQRLAKIDAAAKTPKRKAKPVVYSAFGRVPNQPEPEPAPPSMSEWVERQKQLHKEPWFEITSGPRDFGPTKLGLSIHDIQKAVAEHYGITIHDMSCDRRTANLVLPRQVMFYLCKRLTLKSFPEIGRRSGGRDHTTVLYGVRKIAAMVADRDDERLNASVEFLVHQLGGDPA